MWRLLIFLSSLAAARADCDACIQGLCHSKRTLLEGFHVTDQLAIDRKDNILYVQLDYRTTAFFLNETKMRLVIDRKTKGLAVDQDTQVLYSSSNGVVFAHRYKQGTYKTEPVFQLNHATTPMRLRYEDTLYTINEDGSSAYYSIDSQTFTAYDNLENFQVSDMVNVQNITNWYFVSNDKLYKFMYNWGLLTWQLISEKKHVLSIGRNGDVYFGDASEKSIYKLNRETSALVKYATYLDGSVEDFVFDRDETIVFLDADGNVAQWIPNKKSCYGPYRFEPQNVNDYDTTPCYSGSMDSDQSEEDTSTGSVNHIDTTPRYSGSVDSDQSGEDTTTALVNHIDTTLYYNGSVDSDQSGEDTSTGSVNHIDTTPRYSGSVDSDQSGEDTTTGTINLVQSYEDNTRIADDYYETTEVEVPSGNDGAPSEFWPNYIIDTRYN